MKKIIQIFPTVNAAQSLMLYALREDGRVFCADALGRRWFEIPVSDITADAPEVPVAGSKKPEETK